MVTMERVVISFNVIATGRLVRKKGFIGKKKGVMGVDQLQYIKYMHDTKWQCFGVFYKVERPISILSLWLKAYLV